MRPVPKWWSNLIVLSLTIGSRQSHNVHYARNTSARPAVRNNTNGGRKVSRLESTRKASMLFYPPIRTIFVISVTNVSVTYILDTDICWCWVNIEAHTSNVIWQQLTVFKRLFTWINCSPLWYMHTLEIGGNVYFVAEITHTQYYFQSSMNSHIHRVCIREHTDHYTTCHDFPVNIYLYWHVYRTYVFGLLYLMWHTNIHITLAPATPIYLLI
jgi:hypothetical protein